MLPNKCQEETEKASKASCELPPWITAEGEGGGGAVTAGAKMISALVWQAAIGAKRLGRSRGRLDTEFRSTLVCRRIKQITHPAPLTGDQLTNEPTRPQAMDSAAEQEKAHRRMLGNIQFIGYLYKYGLLTER